MELQRRIAGIAALDQPLRRRLHDLLARTDGWASRDDVAAALGIPRSVAAFHLDKLADAGVVETHFERTSGRSGPGAGRPSKLYRLSSEEVSASIPERRYDLAGSLLAAAVAESTRSGAPVGECVKVVARTAGQALGEEAKAASSSSESSEERRRAVLEVLASHGYEPEIDQDCEIALTNCPFHRLAEEHRTLVCGMNLDFLDGLLEGVGPTRRGTARLDPAPGRCCVRVTGV
jgi:predicted ArsR family transcriptional regulator